MDNFTPNENFLQRVIHENDKIFEVIKEEFSKAKSEILIAAAWFTDPVLFEIITERLKAGVRVSLIIADNTDNEKLPFQQIIDMGGSCIKIKSVGYGIMHQKFCVIDQSIAIHGSYNYTVNARNNNHESVIYTTHKQTVQTLIDTFNNIQSKALDIKAGLQPEINKSSSPIMNDNNMTQPADPEEKHLQDYNKILNSLINAEIRQFDREELKVIGKSRSEASGGDFNTINHALDTIYFKFIEDNHISADEKEKLKLGINQYRESSLQLLSLRKDQNKNAIKTEIDINTAIYTGNINDKNIEIEAKEKKIEGIKNIDVPTAKNRIAGLQAKINGLKREYIQPKLKKFEFIPLIIINSLLLIYLILFYASAAYILIYSKTDINNAIISGQQIPSPSVFEPNAISNAFKHGIIGGFFTIFFFILPVGFTLANRFIDKKWLGNFVSYGIGLFAIDFLVAIFISRQIREIEILINKTNIQWSWSQAFQDINFYLVFVMGAMALLIFKFTYGKLIACLSERNPSVQAQKVALEIEHMDEEIRTIDQDLVRYQKDIENIQLQIIECRGSIMENKEKLRNLPINEVNELAKIENKYNALNQHYIHSANGYLNKVENNNPDISLVALKDRISTFLEGWNDFLFSFFAKLIAEEKSAMATKEVNTWLNTKFKNQIDPILNNNKRKEDEIFNNSYSYSHSVNGSRV